MVKDLQKLVVLCIVAAAIFGGWYLWQARQAPIVGGDRDTHGCLTPAGYAYDEEVGACIRAFEMTDDIKQAAKLAVASVGEGYALTVVSFNSYEEPGAYDIMLERGEERTKETIFIRHGQVVELPTSTDYKNLTFLVSGEPVTFVDGIAETETVMGAASKAVVRYFGNEAQGDIDGDGIVDTVFLVTQETGGSGTFFYLVGALRQEDGTYKGTQAVLIGDRIAPQTTEFKNGLVIVNYADRAPGEPMSARPSIGKSLYLKYDPVRMDFGEVVQNFEGEANLNRRQN